LLFADDLVLFSLHPGELQRNINNLQTYCDCWKLKINIKKTKIIEFCISGKLCNIEFKLSGQVLENVSTYKYLGIHFSSTGSFVFADKVLSNKGLRVAYTVKKVLSEANAKPELGLQLFDQVVKPILTYGSEIWAVNYINKLSDFYSYFEKLNIEKTNLNFCRYILGVNNKSSKIATLGELGKYPLLTDIWISCFKYLEHVKYDLCSSSLAYKALLAQQQLKYQNSWWNSVKRISNSIKIDVENLPNSNLIKKMCESQIC